MHFLPRFGLLMGGGGPGPPGLRLGAERNKALEWYRGEGLGMWWEMADWGRIGRGHGGASQVRGVS